MNFKRTLLSLTIISSILLSNFLFESTKTDELEVKGPKLITMDSRKIVSSTSLAPYKTQDRYISKEYSELYDEYLITPPLLIAFHLFFRY